MKVTRRGGASSTGAAPEVYLSDLMTIPVVVRQPAVTGFGANFGGGLYREFVPLADFTLSGLRDTAPNGPVRAAVWQTGQQGAALAVGSLVNPAQGVPYESAFAAPVVLQAGTAYRIGWILSGAGPLLPGLNEPVTYDGFTVGRSALYPGSGNAGYPGSSIGVDAYSPTFDLLSVPSGEHKTVQGPLDPLDFPVVDRVGLLLNGSAAILDKAGSAPRLVFKRPDGSVWYGAAFSDQAPAPPVTAFSQYRLNIGEAAANDPYVRVMTLDLHAQPGGANIATGGTAFDNGNLGGGFGGAAAFDADDSTGWLAPDPDSSRHAVLGYILPAPVAVKEYAIVVAQDVRAPVAWTFEGSNDGSSWVVLDQRSGIAFANGERKVFAVS